MAKGCVCDTSLIKLKNTHSNKRNAELAITTKKDDEGIILFEQNEAIACFDIKYCPVCGRKL